MKILCTLRGGSVAPRFDLCVEVAIAEVKDGRLAGEARLILLSGPSAEELCGLVIREGIGVVICGGIEEAHFRYLSWKRVQVLDRVIGPWPEALARAAAGELTAGRILRPAVAAAANGRG
ncbi:MAG: hypothetical protein AB1634_19065 [Thermodesulfobacteriota bacterium]